MFRVLQVLAMQKYKRFSGSGVGQQQIEWVKYVAYNHLYWYLFSSDRMVPTVRFLGALAYFSLKSAK